jgi:hypothetical protein
LYGFAGGHDGGVRSVVLVTASAVLAFVLTWSGRAFGASSVGFAFVVVWAPMTWLGVVSRVAQVRLPQRYHALRPFERSGRAYELVGVRVVKAVLRRGPLAVFNPDLHLPAERSPTSLAHLDQRMRDAEASHAVLLALTLGVVVHAAARGWWPAALATLVFDVLLNGYPVILQRYNRAKLAERFDLGSA